MLHKNIFQILILKVNHSFKKKKKNQFLDFFLILFLKNLWKYDICFFFSFCIKKKKL